MQMPTSPPKRLLQKKWKIPFIKIAPIKEKSWSMQGKPQTKEEFGGLGTLANSRDFCLEKEKSSKMSESNKELLLLEFSI